MHIERFLLTLLSILLVFIIVSSISNAQCTEFLSLTGESAGDYFGWSVAEAGDFNGDGNEDFVVAAPAKNGSAGIVYVFSGITGNILSVINGETAGDQFGLPVAYAGNVNGDEYDDIIIGARFYDNGFSSTGRIYVFFGGPGPFPDTINAGDAEIIVSGTGAGDRLGYTVSGAGDINNDEYDDFIAGATHDPSYGGNDSSQAHVFLGGPGPYPVSATTSDADLTILTEDPGDFFGGSVSNAGDINNDGYEDVIVGAWDGDRAYLFLGNSGPYPVTVSAASADIVILGEVSGDYFGGVSEAGDFNQDGYDDFLVSARYNDEAGVDAGKVYVFLGESGTYPATFNATDANLTFLGESAGDWFGNSMACAGDVNTDGFDDIIIGAPQQEPNDSGKAYIYYGGYYDGKGVNTTDADVVLSGEASGDLYGVSVSGIGDINSDGSDDIIVGAFKNDAGGENAGSAYIYDCLGQMFHIWIDSLSVGTGNSKVMMSNFLSVSAFTLPLKFSSPYGIDSVIAAGCRTEGWDSFYGTLHNDSTVLIGGVSSLGGGNCMEAGVGCIAKIYWDIPCDADTAMVCFDTIFISEQAPLLVVDCEIPENEYTPAFYPGCSYFDGLWYIPGDANRSGSVNIADAVRLINNIFTGGPPADPHCAGDTNGDCNTNVSDAVYIINYIFLEGPAPVQYCSNPVGTFNKTIPDQAELNLRAFQGGNNKVIKAKIESSRVVQALQLEFSSIGDVHNIQASGLINGLQTFQGNVNGHFKAGMLDLNGQVMLPTGNDDVLEISYQGSGTLKLVNAVLSGTDGFDMNVTINSRKVEGEVPRHFALQQNFPNPFNPETEISYSIPEGCNVTLDIYNIKGQNVATLVEGYKDAGSYAVKWDSRGADGHQVASGIYFYRLTAGEFTKTVKMVLMK
ncbi:MAG TPA: T9SS type A sorting domain-containing protein [candidate division Zixibacteria bacterium]|nr:T9SS type A sorting domain-containing protein [candidate division Zixibacteria bacterium]